MKLFFNYLKTKLKSILLFFIFSLLFVISFALYRLPIAAVIYPLILCLALGIAYLIADFIRVRKKYSALTYVKKMTADMIESLPAADTLIDGEYREIVLYLKQEIMDTQVADDAKYRDMIDYYTVWAHQIKTPIAGMKITLQNDDSPISRRLSSDLFRIEQYVEMVLAFLRLGSETSDYVFGEHRVDTIVRASLKKFAPEFIGKKLSLTYEPIEYNIVTDEKWFSFVIEQVLSNALKYTREGGVTVEERGGKLVISDTGIGISPADLPRIFDKGYTGHNGRIDKSASGLGLYLCKRICDNLGLGIKAESSVGEGTSIYIDLEQNRTTLE